MNTLVNLEWRNLNSNRNYPFADSATMGFAEYILPQSWILDARIYIRNSYNQEQPCYISKLVRTAEAVVLTVSSSETTVVGQATISLTSSADMINVLDGTIVTGCLVIDPNRTSLLQAVDEGEYVLEATVAPIVASCCEFLPSPQVQSINSQVDNVTLVAREGISLSREDNSTIKVSIIGDPHFTRYNCAPTDGSAAEQVLLLRSVFLERFSVIHYIKVGEDGRQLVTSRLIRAADGSIQLALQTNVPDIGATPEGNRATRPAFRITATENTITFSLAGA